MPGDMARLYELFDRAVDLSPAERSELIDELRRSDEALAARLEQMLTEDSEGATTASPRSGDEQRTSFRTELLAGKMVGQYRIVRELGRGGMGVVFEAEQDHPNRRVALKIIQASLLSSEGRQRFELEAKVLARLSHPSVAHVYDAGSAELDGVRYPYLVMELIDGPPLDAYVREHASPREALELFVQVCDAVQRAHDVGIVHRDLKPQNILVVRDAPENTGDEAQARPKILDFGVARVTNADLDASSMVTATGQIVGTVGYMSPEQLAGDSKKVDARSDVYALGVVLFKLLSGRLPHDIDGKLLPEIIVDVRDSEPLRIGTVRPEFSGDIDTIVAKALEKEPDRRYATAAELADDVRRHLDDQPITARPPSLAYRVRKFTLRHRGLVASVALAGSALFVALAITTSALVEATNERDAKQVALESSTAMSTFLSELLAGADPYRAGATDVTVRQVLDRASEDIGRRFQRQPYVEAKLRTSLGQAYTGLSLYARAVEELRRAQALWDQLEQPPNRDTFTTSVAMGTALHSLENSNVKPCDLMADAIKRHEGRLPNDDALVLHAYGAAVRACANLGRNDEADELYDRAISVGVGLDDPRMFDLGIARSIQLVILGRLETSEAYLRPLVASAEKNFGRAHPNTLLAQRYLGTSLSMQGKHEAALDVYGDVYEGHRQGVGPLHFATIISLCKYARSLAKLDRGAEALALLDATIEQLVAEKKRVTPHLLYAKGVVLLALERYEDAEKVLAENLRVELEEHGTESIDAALSHLKYGTALQRVGKHTAAAAQAKAGLRIASQRFPDNKAVVGPLRTLLAESEGRK